MLADFLCLCDVHGVDGPEERDRDEMLDREDEEQGNDPEGKDRLLCLELSGRNYRSSVAIL